MLIISNVVERMLFNKRRIKNLYFRNFHISYIQINIEKCKLIIHYIIINIYLYILYIFYEYMYLYIYIMKKLYKCINIYVCVIIINVA